MVKLFGPSPEPRWIGRSLSDVSPLRSKAAINRRTPAQFSAVVADGKENVGVSGGVIELANRNEKKTAA